ncbi:hypothetical protein Cob_v012166 [Colletotrichum orbiculare MAFF 240422]|uniref:Uncharacterized protein n=1 Tax=Colletotrichum orbiculare (strain 104-T / ATCC 96160 / CBS 514.97 / LARS 414 / MAFF 240422) TaxID=1213857 RepID=N4VVU2_COLOR|nr:hypothetical protein Cob_v012166 [Colletotrichum orbiculare MAFF 240422]
MVDDMSWRHDACGKTQPRSLPGPEDAPSSIGTVASHLGYRQWTEQELMTRGQKICGLEGASTAELVLALLDQRLADIDEVLRQIAGRRPIFSGPENEYDMEDQDDEHIRQSQTLTVQEKQRLLLANRLRRQQRVIRDAIHQHQQPQLSTPPPGSAGHAQKNQARLETLPYEIRTEIVSLCMGYDNVRDGTATNSHFISQVGLKNIQSLRLTCKGLHDAASPELLPCITVHLTEDSLSRLRQLSQNPLIARGIKCVRLALPYLSSSVAKNEQSFCFHAAWLIKGIIAYNSQKDIDEAIDPNKIRHLNSLVSQWDNLIGALSFNADGTPQTDCTMDTKWITQFNRHPLLVEGFAKVKERYLEYQRLLDHGHVAEGIAEAMGRMPKVTKLCMSDMAWDHDWKTKYYLSGIFPNRESMLSLIAAPMEWGTFASLPPKLTGQPPLEILTGILPALARRGVQLDNLDIQLTAPSDLTSLTPSDAALTAAAVKDLQVFRFRMVPALFNFVRRRGRDSRIRASRIWAPRPVGQMSSLNKLLDALLQSQNLKWLWLDLESLKVESRGDRPTGGGGGGGWYLPAVMKARKWPHIRKMTLSSVCLNSKLLGKFLGDGPLVIDRLKDAHVSRGTWVEALEVLRDKETKSLRLETIDGASGAECNIGFNDMFFLTPPSPFCREDMINLYQYIPADKPYLALGYIWGVVDENPLLM